VLQVPDGLSDPACPQVPVRKSLLGSYCQHRLGKDSARPSPSPWIRSPNMGNMGSLPVMLAGLIATSSTKAG
jgi:hypothetical protein